MFPHAGAAICVAAPGAERYSYPKTTLRNQLSYDSPERRAFLFICKRKGWKSSCPVLGLGDLAKILRSNGRPVRKTF